MDKKIEKAIQKLLEMYERIENDLLIKIASHFSVEDEFQNSDYWRIKKLEEMGLFNQDIIDYLKRETKGTDKEIKRALNQIGIDTIDLDRLNRLFEDEVLKINPDILSNNYTIRNIINTAYDELSNTLIQMSSKIERSTREAYLNVVESTYLKTSMGTHSYQEAIRIAINDLSNQGINTLTYKTVDEDGNITGIRNYDIESTVRREILTASRQLNNAIAMEVANELECEYLYLSEHLQCRPSHFDWQGTIIKREDLVRITKYGEIDGLAGINCRHYFEPYFGDARENDLKHFNKEECTNAYNLSQQQRYLERGIRKWKRKAEMFKTNDDIDAYSKCRDKVKEWQSKIDSFVKENDLRRDFNREYVKESKNRIIKKETYKDVTQEWLDNATPNNLEIIEDDKYYKDDNGIKYFVDGKNVIYSPSEDEIENANWLRKKIGGKIRIQSKVNKPNHIKCPDYKWKVMEFNEEKWDLKTLGKDAISKTRAVDNNVKKAKWQSNNFIIKINDECTLTNEEVISQVKRLYGKQGREWIDKIIIRKNEDVIGIYIRK